MVLKFPQTDNIVCHKTAEYMPENPEVNRLSSGYIAQIENIDQVRQITGATHVAQGNPMAILYAAPHD